MSEYDSTRWPISRINRLLFPLLGSDELVNKWWISPNKAFDNTTPSTMYVQDIDRVIKYILCQYNSDYS